MLKKYSNYIDDAFYLTLILKGVGGALELLLSLIVLFVSTDSFFHILEHFKHLGVDTSESLAHSAKNYVFWYLFSHGVIRLGLAFALLKEYMWAYPLAIAVLSLFILYQAYLMIHSFSIGLLGLTLFNLFIAGLAVYEYLHLRKGGHLHRPQL
jgi:uncharacterized membrane protein